MLLLSVVLTVLANILSTKGLISRHVSVHVHALVNIHVHIHVHSMQYDHKRNRNRNMNTYKGIDMFMGTDSDIDTDKNGGLVKDTETHTCHTVRTTTVVNLQKWIPPNLQVIPTVGDRIGSGVKAVHSGKTIFAFFFCIVPILSPEPRLGWRQKGGVELYTNK